MADKTKEYFVIIEGLKVRCRMLVMASDGICTIIAVGSNCCYTKHIDELIETLREVK